jgi:chemotaxis methyl-accepting protein methylase
VERGMLIISHTKTKKMYKELKKFATSKKIDSVGVLPNGTNFKITLDEYQAELGDLIEDFIKHKTKPFYKRKHYDSHLTKIYKDMLNQITIKHGL